MSQTVYVVTLGESNEGSRNVGVFAMHDAAVDYCERLIRTDSRAKRPWKRDNSVAWSSGVDQLCIEKWDVGEELPLPQ